jgi:hypothetical protein
VAQSGHVEPYAKELEISPIRSGEITLCTTNGGNLQVMKYDRVIAELSLVRSLNSFPSPRLLHPRIILANKGQATHKSTLA